MRHTERHVPKRYAHALFDAATAKGVLDNISAEFSVIYNIITTDESLINFLAAPHINDENKFQLIDGIFKGRFSELTYNFIKLTVEKRRSQYLREIIDRFTALVEEAKGILRVRVTTAVAMDLRHRDELAARLGILTGKKINVYPEIDKSLIGGVIIYMNNQVIDDSVRHKLDLIRHRLLSLKVH